MIAQLQEFIRDYRFRLCEQIDAVENCILNGGAFESMEDFREFIGRRKAFITALQEFEDAVTQLKHFDI